MSLQKTTDLPFEDQYIPVDLLGRIVKKNGRDTQGGVLSSYRLSFWCCFYDRAVDELVTLYNEFLGHDHIADLHYQDIPACVSVVDCEGLDKHIRFIRLRDEQHVAGLSFSGGDWYANPHTGELIDVDRMSDEEIMVTNIRSTGRNGFSTRAHSRAMGANIVHRLAEVNPAASTWFFSDQY